MLVEGEFGSFNFKFSSVCPKISIGSQLSCESLPVSLIPYCSSIRFFFALFILIILVFE
jgi:hypothetical protein